MTDRIRHVAGCCALLVLSAVGCSSARSGSRPLFNGKDLTGWTEIGSSGAWSVEDGVLKCNGQKTGYAWLCTDRKYGDFALSLEWRIGPRANTGVFCRVPGREGRASMTGFEVQIADDSIAKGQWTEISGCVFRRIPNPTPIDQPVGRWHRYDITCQGSRLTIACDGRTLIETDMATAPVDPQNLPSLRDVPAEGYIGLQNHGNPAEFRNITIRELTPPYREASRGGMREHPCN